MQIRVNHDGCRDFRTAVRFGFARLLMPRLQHLSSGNASVGVIFRTAGFTVMGQTSEYLSRADSGAQMRRRFCPACGTPLFSEALEEPNYMVVRAGTLDDREIARPASVIWTASAPSWGHVDPALPASSSQPGPVAG